MRWRLSDKLTAIKCYGKWYLISFSNLYNNFHGLFENYYMNIKRYLQIHIITFQSICVHICLWCVSSSFCSRCVGFLIIKTEPQLKGANLIFLKRGESNVFKGQCPKQKKSHKLCYTREPNQKDLNYVYLKISNILFDSKNSMKITIVLNWNSKYLLW